MPVIRPRFLSNRSNAHEKNYNLPMSNCLHHARIWLVLFFLLDPTIWLDLLEKERFKHTYQRFNFIMVNMAPRHIWNLNLCTLNENNIFYYYQWASLTFPIQSLLTENWDCRLSPWHWMFWLFEFIIVSLTIFLENNKLHHLASKTYLLVVSWV